jgi:DNA invertase Pin-like site-specific DNA recombinase
MATSGRPLPHEIRREILRLLQDRISLRNVARRYGVCVATVHKLKKKGQEETTQS